jgi:hypothetical protein
VHYGVPVAPREAPPVPARASLVRTSIQTSAALLGAAIGGAGYAFSAGGCALFAAETVAGATLPVYLACWTLAALAPVDFWFAPAAQQAAPAPQTQPEEAEEPEPALRWAAEVVVPVPPVLCVRFNTLTEAQKVEYSTAYAAFHRDVCRAVNVSAHSLSLRVGSERLIQ